MLALACQHRTYLDGERLFLSFEFEPFHIFFVDFLRLFKRYHLVFDSVNFARIGVAYIYCGVPAFQTIFKAFDDGIAFVNGFDVYALNVAAVGAAVFFADNDVLRHIDKTARKITGVCRLKRGVCKTFTAAVRRNEVFQNRQTLSEGRLNRRFQRFSLRVGHKTTHAGKLSYLFHAAASSGHCHHVYGVKFVQCLFERSRYVVVGFFPLVDDETIFFVFGKFAFLVKLFYFDDFVFGPVEYFLLFGRNVHIKDAGGDRTDCGIFVSERLDVVQHNGSFGSAFFLESGVDYLFEQAFVHALGNFGVEFVFFIRSINKAEILRNRLVENEFSDGGLDDTRLHYAVEFLVNAHVDCRLQFNFVIEVRHLGFVYVAESHSFALRAGFIHREIERTYNHILCGRTYRLAVGEL